MTLAEKLGQLTMLSPLPPGHGPPIDLADMLRTGKAGSILNVTGATPIAELQRVAIGESRLGIPALFALDVLHGYRTIFPVPLGESAAFDPALWEETAAAAAAEARNDGIALTFAPMLDVSRDARWGRMAESPGEDPWVASVYARAKVRGFQGVGPDIASGESRVAAVAKHFVGYGAVAGGRDYASVDMSERSLHSVYLPPFKAAVEAGVAAVMPAFINLAGTPMTASPTMLRDLLRHRWGFEGVIISDYGAIGELVAHGVASDQAEAAALAIRAGVDVDMMSGAYLAGLPVAIERGLVSIADVDAAVRRVLLLKDRLGLFAKPQPDRAGPTAAASATRALARRAAEASIVMLKNDRDVLPLSPTGGPIALIGPLASSPIDLLGPWAGVANRDDVADIVTAMRLAFPDRSILHACGSSIDTMSEVDLTAALNAARAAEVTVLCLGESREMSGEGASRASPVVPNAQMELARRVLELNRPTVLVLVSGRPLVATELIRDVDAALAAWFPGCEGGPALAAILSGSVSPSGKLPVSWPAAIGQIPIHYGELPTGRPASDTDRYTSRYLDAPVLPLYPFGHGLAYTSFEVDGLTLDENVIEPTGHVQVTVAVRNAGPRSGETTIFLFIRDTVASVARPLIELRRFARVSLASGERTNVLFDLDPSDLAWAGEGIPEPGLFEIRAGFSADQAKLATALLTVAVKPGKGPLQ